MDLRQLDVEITEPSPMVSDPGAETNRRAVLKRERVLSPQTWQLQEQLDPQHEAANWKAWDAANPQEQQGGGDSQQWHREPGPAKESTDKSGHKHKGKGPDHDNDDGDE